MVRIDAVYQGDLHTECQHGPSGAKLGTDAPRDNQGRGEAFSPTDLVGASLASCMLTVMGIRAREAGWAIEGARASVEKHMRADPRRVARLVVRIAMPAGVPESARAPLEHAARTCPVAESLHPDLEVDLTLDWSGQAD